MKLSVNQEVPAEYSRSRWNQIISKIEQAFNTLQSGALAGRYYASAAPTTGTWAQGDIVWNSAVNMSGDPIGWVCTTAGSPGTWKPWGAVIAGP